MRMKAIVGLLIVCLLVVGLGGATVCAEETVVFESDTAYVTEQALSAFPVTIEASLNFPADFSKESRGGVVFGNYAKSGAACINFEIHQNGAPRMYYIDNDGDSHDYLFEQVNVYTGEWVHLALVRDAESGSVACYVNGELKQTLRGGAPSEITFTERAVIGGDMRAGNTQYFKGALRNIVLYTDARTADEIAADCTAATPDTDELMGFYELKNAKESLRDTFGKGPEFSKISRALFLKNYTPVTDYDYSFAVVGDIQTLTCYYPDNVANIYDWIVANAKSKKIAFVAGLGDITDKDTDEEWELAEREISKLNGVVPFSVVRGNHDSAGKYKNWFSYEEYGSTADGCLKETLLNTYHKVKVKGVKYLFLNLDLIAADSTLDWANEVIAAHSDYNVIITTHIYLSQAGSTFNDVHGSDLTRYGMLNYPDVIWDRVVSQHSNISMVLCGHAPTDNIVVNQRQGVHGNTVTEILIDPQTTDKTHEATGLVAMLNFSNGGKTVDVEYYSTVKEAYFLEENQFRIEVDVLESKAAPWWWVLLSIPIGAAVVLGILLLKKRNKNATCKNG